MPDNVSAPDPVPAPAGRTRGKKTLKYAIILIVLVASLWYAMRDVNWNGLWSAIAEVKLPWLGAVAGAVIVAHFIRAYRWRLLIPDGKKIRLLNAFSATMIGYMMNNIIPRSGEVMRPYVLARRENRTTSSVLATILVERIIDGILLLVIFVLLLFVAQDNFDRLLPGYSVGDVLKALGIPIAALIIALIVALKTRAGDWVLNKLQRRLSERLHGRLRDILLNFRSGVDFGSAPATALMSGLSVMIWIFYGLSIYFGFLAFGFDTAYHVGVREVLTLLGVTSIAITISPTPGGFGVYHSFCKTALMALYGMSAEHALAFAIVVHGAPYLLTMLIGAGFALRESALLTQARRKGPKAADDARESQPNIS